MGITKRKMMEEIRTKEQEKILKRYHTKQMLCVKVDVRNT